MKYITRAYHEWNDGDHLTCTVHEAEQEPIDTGLLDAHGTKIFRIPSKNPVGFALGS
jgi:hypothetical protein